MTTKNLKLLLLALISFCFFACSDDDSKSKGEGQKPETEEETDEVKIKALIGCEGSYMEGTATLDIIFDDNTVENNAFKKRNGRPVGDVVQSITEIDNKLFVTLSNSSKIEIMNKEDLKQIATILGLKEPQYISKISDSRAVVSHLKQNYLTIIDTKEYKIVSTVPTKDRVKQMITVGDRLFVAEDESIEVFSIKNDDITPLDMLGHPVTSNTSLIQAADNNIWALCCAYEKGGKDFTTIKPEKDNNAYLVSIDPTTLKEVKRIPLQDLYPQKFSAKLGVNNNGTELYIALWKDYEFITIEYGDSQSMNIKGELGLYKVAIADKEIKRTPLFTLSDKAATFYSFALTPNNTIYICDAIDYTQNGKIIEYSEKGEKLNEYQMGISPQYVLFY